MMKRWMPVLAAVLTCAVFACPVRAQRAPAGNEHPTASVDERSGLANPFGTPTGSDFDTKRKEAFSRAVDISPLRDLAVLHNGRVKILDTLAREVIGQILGRKDYVDFDVDPNQREARRIAYDPMFTFMDLCIDPGYYIDRPLIHVPYLPLREALLARMYTKDEEREWWKRVGRLKPIEMVKYLEPVEQAHAFEMPFNQALQGVRTSMLLFERSPQLLVMLAPDSSDKPWDHLSLAGAETPIGKASRELGVAWRAGDADKANAAIKTLAAELPKVNSSYYPTTRRSLEAAYNRTNAFEWGYWMYALALLTFLLAFGTGRPWMARAGLVFFFLALGLHAFGFVARCIIAERFAIQNQYESMTGLSLFAAVVGAVLMLARRQWLFGAAAAGVGFLVLMTATQTGIPGANVEREAPILNTSILLKYHVTTVLVSYGLISLGFMVSLFYLGTYYASRAKARLAVAGSGRGGGGAGDGGGIAKLAMPGGGMVEMSATALGIQEDSPAAGPARVLHDLDKAQMVILQLAFWALGVGILLGAWWADHSWGRWWAFDPKELWALVTWIVYLIVIHLRVASIKNKALVTAWLSVVGFIVMLWTYFGVNLLLPGLHAYA